MSRLTDKFNLYSCTSSSRGRRNLLPLYSRAFLFIVLILFAHISCVTPTQIIRESSSSEKPTWIDSPQQGNETLYFVGIKTSAETLEDGRNSAISDAMSKISHFMGSKIESVFEDYISEVEQKLKHQIRSKSSSNIKGAQVVDSYYEKMLRIDENYKMEKYDVYVLVKFSKSEIEKEIERQQKIKQEKMKIAHGYYLDGLNKENNKKYYDARRYYNQALSILDSFEDVIIFTETHVIKNSDELRLRLQSHLNNVTLFLSRVELSIDIDGPPNGVHSFIANFISVLNKHGFTISDNLPAIKITGRVYVSESSYTMKNYFFYAEGSISAQRTLDSQIVAEYPFKVKGVHRLKKNAALNALAEAGLDAGSELSKMILKKESIK